MNNKPTDNDNVVPFSWKGEVESTTKKQRTDIIQSPTVLQSRIDEILNYGNIIWEYKAGITYEISDNSDKGRAYKVISKWDNNAREIADRSSQVIRTLFQQGQENENIFRSLVEVHSALNDNVKDIYEAVLTLDAAFQKYFPGINIRIILANNEWSSGRAKNPIANMLADMIEIGSEHTENQTVTASTQPTKLQRIAHLLPVVQGTITNEPILSRELTFINADGYHALLEAGNGHRFIEGAEAKLLDPNIFGKQVGSALFQKIENVGAIAFIAEDPEKFNNSMNPLLVEGALKMITTTLGHIASNEENSRDTLTKLPTRRYLLQNLDSIFKTAMESQTDLNLVVVDLDKFKHVNDTYGHSAGDFVLKTFAYILATKLSGDDKQFRWWGEEFVAILMADPIHAANAIRRVADWVSLQTFGISDKWEHSLYPPGKDIPSNIRTYQVTISAGLESISPKDIARLNGNYIPTFEKMFDNADARVYISKHHGRNKVVHSKNQAEIERLPETI